MVANAIPKSWRTTLAFEPSLYSYLKAKVRGSDFDISIALQGGNRGLSLAKHETLGGLEPQIALIAALSRVLMIVQKN